jgi:beta-glucosidase-like glycosyl hydrolase
MSLSKAILIVLILVPLAPGSMRSQSADWVEATLRSMTLEEKVGQIFIADLVAVYAHKQSPVYKLAEDFVRQYHVGGFILAGGTVTDIALTTNRLQRESKLPLIMNADLEGGLWFNHPYRWMQGRGPELPRFVGGGGTSLPSLMAIGATGNPHFAYEFGRITAREGRAAGIHWTNSPVADVNNNPKNPIVNTRSFGEDPVRVAAMVEAYVRGLQSEKMIATPKHFPGHGDTEEDSHMKLPVLPFDRFRLDSVEFVPFKAGIDAGAGAVMTAHIAMPKVDPVERPATLSPVMITDMLRRHLGFKGIVITDGMTMQGVTDHYSAAEAAVKSLEAGADAILVPADLAAAYNGVLRGVRSGRLPEKRLDESVRRILAAKQWAGLDRNRFVEIDKIADVVGSPPSELSADSMFSAAVTLVRNDPNVVPLSPRARIGVITLTDDADPYAGGALADILRPGAASVGLSRIWNESGERALDQALANVEQSDVLVIGVYLSIGAWKGGLGLSPGVQKFLAKIQSTGKPAVTIAFGDPYVLGKVPTTAGMMAVYNGLRKAEEAAGRALRGMTATQGRLPVTIPGVYPRGAGIQLLPAGKSGN